MQKRLQLGHRHSVKRPNNPRQLPAPAGTNSPPSHVEYRVGPGHPPKQYQFKKGQSGNPLGAKLTQRSIVPDLKALLQRALNEKMPKRQGEKMLTKAAAGMRHLVDQFARGDRNARRDLVQIAEKLGIDLMAGEHNTIQQSVAAALTQTDQEIVDEFIQDYLAERAHSRKHRLEHKRKRYAKRGDSLMRHVIHELEPRVLNAMTRLSFPSFVWRCFPATGRSRQVAEGRRTSRWSLPSIPCVLHKHDPFTRTRRTFFQPLDRTLDGKFGCGPKRALCSSMQRSG
jgi:hypothetical protein